ncbi:MAG: site-specific integrase [Sulfuriferula sp.]|nr:site-specific integrase [Sulfuriferula sp.]
MATVRKLPSGKWNAQIRMKGHPQASKSFPSKALADKWVKITESEMIRHIYTKANATTLAEALDRYRLEITPSKKGAKIELIRINQWLQHPLAQKPLDTLKPQDFAKHRDSRLQTGIAASTIRSELAIISHLFTIAAKEWGMSLVNPIDSIRKPKADNARDRRLDKDELIRLLAACSLSDSHLLPYLVEFAMETGMRLGEILSITWDMVNYTDKTIKLSTTKNGDSRTVPLSSHAIYLLKNMPKGEDSDKVKHIFYTWKRSDSIKRSWHTALNRAGITNFHFHDLRHEATTRFFEKGFNVMEVASITGHRTLQMLKRYTHLKATDLAVRLH